MEPYDVIPDDTPPPGCPAPCPILDDAPDLPYSLAYEEPDGAQWVITAAEKGRIDRSAQLGRDLILSARAGNQQALADLQHTLHVTRYEVAR